MSAFSQTGDHSLSASGSAGLGFGAGLSVTGTFDGTWQIGNIGETVNWWADVFAPSAQDQPDDCL